MGGDGDYVTVDRLGPFVSQPDLEVESVTGLVPDGLPHHGDPNATVLSPRHGGAGGDDGDDERNEEERDTTAHASGA